MRILLLHGLESAPGGTKSDFLASKGCTLVNPALPKESWERSLAIAQEAFDEGLPDVVIGSSRGGALAMNIDTRGVRRVLVAAAWRKYGRATTVPANTILLHSENDDVIPIADSRELAERSGLPPNAVVVVGDDHRMKDPAALEALWSAVSAKAG